MKDKILRGFIIGIFVSLYLLVSIISTIHVVDFFELSNPRWMAITLAVGFEIGAAASLASLIIMDKMNKTLVWSLFITITAMQINGNLYYAFINMQDYQNWVELFNLVEWEELEKKRLLSAVSGAILPLVALGFIKSLVDYIKPATPGTVDDSVGFNEVESELDSENYRQKDYRQNANEGSAQQGDYFEDDDPVLQEETEPEKAPQDYAEPKQQRPEQSEEADSGLDEDQELDQILNNMAPELEAKDISDQKRFDQEVEPWDGTLMDGLEDEPADMQAFQDLDQEEQQDEEDRQDLDVQHDLDQEDEEDALKKALERKAEQDKQQYLKDSDNGDT